MVKAIVREIELRKDYLAEKKIDSIYFGGGTPSLLGAEDLDAILGKLGDVFTWDEKAELTLEANPDDIQPENLRLWQRLGINRLSIGLQSFNDEELKWMNRAHTAAESFRSVKLAQDEGFNNLSIDLIYGSKFQTQKSWEKTLQQAIELNTTHISSYNLTIENKTALGNHYRKGKEPPVNEDLSSRQFLMMAQVLESSGYLHYEISNFGKPGFFAVHNSSYWKQKPYLGLGPSAHSYNNSSRQLNVRNNHQYIKALEEGLDFFDKEILDLATRYNEYVLTRLRTIWGCDLKEIKNLFGEEICHHFLKSLKKWEQCIETEGDLVRLNRQGKLQADGIAAELFL